jgi:hypothetical protein
MRQYRVFNAGSEGYGLRLVETDARGQMSWAEYPVEPRGRTKAELRENLEAMFDAFDRPVLTYADLDTEDDDPGD